MSRFSGSGNSIFYSTLVLSFTAGCTGTISPAEGEGAGGNAGSSFTSTGGAAGVSTGAGGKALGGGGMSSAGRNGNGGRSGSNGNGGTISGSGATPTTGGGGSVSPAGVTVIISPKSVGLAPGGKQQFSCTVTGSSNQSCTWSVTESGGGSITTSGAYSAPTGVGTYHVVAKSAADAAASATAIVTITDHQVGKCDSLAAPGTWENITPPQLNRGNWCVPGGNCSGGQLGTYGTNSFVLDPNNTGTVYLGTASLGLWKTTDCGSTWVKINTGSSATELDAGRNWSLVIDPTNSQVLYTVTGYAGSGFYKTTDGGKNWTQKFPDAQLKLFPPQGIEKLSMDPTNNLHLTATFHSICDGNPNGGGQWPCIAETKDGGATFTLTKSPREWSEGDGQTMLDENTWFFSTGAEILRTTDAGKNWTLVYDGAQGQYITSGCIYPAKDGNLYTGGARGMARSTNGGVKWDALPNAPNIGGPNGNCPMVDDGTNFYVSMGLIAYDPPTTDWFYKGTGSPPSKWGSMNNPPVITGGLGLALDPDHKLLYSSNSTGGFYRVVVQ